MWRIHFTQSYQNVEAASLDLDAHGSNCVDLNVRLTEADILYLRLGKFQASAILEILVFIPLRSLKAASVAERLLIYEYHCGNSRIGIEKP